MDWRPISGGVEILLVASCYKNQDNFQQDGPLFLDADFTFTFLGSSNVYMILNICILMFTMGLVLVTQTLFYIWQNETLLCKRFTIYVLKYDLMAKENLIVPMEDTMSLPPPPPEDSRNDNRMDSEA